MIPKGEGPIDDILHRFSIELFEAGVDACQIMGTCISEGGEVTMAFSKGYGNTYARDGLAREYLIQSRVQIEENERQGIYEQ